MGRFKIFESLLEIRKPSFIIQFQRILNRSQFVVAKKLNYSMTISHITFIIKTHILHFSFHHHPADVDSASAVVLRFLRLGANHRPATGSPVNAVPSFRYT